MNTIKNTAINQKNIFTGKLFKNRIATGLLRSWLFFISPEFCFPDEFAPRRITHFLRHMATLWFPGMVRPFPVVALRLVLPKSYTSTRLAAGFRVAYSYDVFCFSSIGAGQCGNAGTPTRNFRSYSSRRSRAHSNHPLTRVDVPTIDGWQ